ncbi:MAG: pyridoxamine 5'-phosphate oxidase family protein [Desulfovibrionales bacterium]
MKKPEHHQKLRNILRNSRHGVLSTCGNRRPYASLMAIAVLDDLSGIIMATDRHTRKFDNLVELPWAALLMDNRDRESPESGRGFALTAEGRVTVPSGGQEVGYKEMLANAHPRLSGFLENESTAVLLLQVEQYVLVEDFGIVTTIAMKRQTQEE